LRFFLYLSDRAGKKKKEGDPVAKVKGKREKKEEVAWASSLFRLRLLRPSRKKKKRLKKKKGEKRRWPA